MRLFSCYSARANSSWKVYILVNKGILACLRSCSIRWLDFSHVGVAWWASCALAFGCPAILWRRYLNRLIILEFIALLDIVIYFFSIISFLWMAAITPALMVLIFHRSNLLLQHFNPFIFILDNTLQRFDIGWCLCE
jgi:hypothetical protein